jgi:2-polyprenyl-6-methoxyphenol hydroxylase-like FAD-dependent oxidoreductase
MAQERVPVLIVGAGEAGLSLSLLLQQAIRPVLIERRPDVSWYPRARNLNFRTMEVFRGLGLRVLPHRGLSLSLPGGQRGERRRRTAARSTGQPEKTRDATC